jgi:thiol-disulfide isomerase/thioredoxin
MRKILLLLAVFTAINTTTFADFVFKGKIITYNGSAPVLANVSYKDADDSTYIEQADKDGNYTFKVKDAMTVELLFTAANHLSLSQKFPIPSGKDFLQVNVKLKPLKKLTNVKEVSIRGNFNEFSNENAPNMTKNDNGTYTFKVKNISDTLLYQICPEYNDRVGDHTFNGTQSDFYVYDKGGDYISGIVNKSKEFNIEFNPALFPEGNFKTEVTISDEKYSKDFEIYKQITKQFNNYIRDRSGIIFNNTIPDDQKHDKGVETKIQYLNKIDSLITNVKLKEFRYLSILEYLSVAHDGVNVDGIEKEINKTLLNEIYEVSPDSKLWSDGAGNYYSLVFAEILLGNVSNPEYMNKVLKAKQPENVKAGMLEVIIQYCSRNKLPDLQDKYYDILQNEYSGSKEAKRARFQFSKDKAIQVGKNIPDFSMKNLDNETENITPETLAGKYVLIDVWGTWCGPCLMELPTLVNVYNKFKDKNFTIYSIAIDGSAATVKKFRENSNKLPWLKPEEQPKSNLPWIHSYAGNWDSDIVNKLEVLGVPSPILIDPEGKIIALEGLRGEELEKTLEKFMK